MCGIVGVIGLLLSKHENMFYDMLTIDVVRGPHSTGITSVDLHGEILVVKDILLPNELYGTKEFENITSRRYQRILMGHNRYATKGDVIKENAHPFTHGAITGMHNGTLISTNHLPKHLEYDTDSEAIISSINEIGIADTWGKVDGAAACAWYDQDEGSMNIITNSKRPLYGKFTEDGTCFVYASEAWMFEAAASRNKVELKQELLIPVKDTLYTMRYNPTKTDIQVEERKLAPFVFRGAYAGHGAISGIGKEEKWRQAWGEKNIIEQSSANSDHTWWEDNKLYKHGPLGRKIMIGSRAPKAYDFDKAIKAEDKAKVEGRYPPNSTPSSEAGTEPIETGEDLLKSVHFLKAMSKCKTDQEREILRDRVTRKSLRRQKKLAGRLKAQSKRGGKSRSLMTLHSKPDTTMGNAMKDADFYERYGTHCVLCCGNYLDRETVVIVDSTNAVCESCARNSEWCGESLSEALGLPPQ